MAERLLLQTEFDCVDCGSKCEESKVTKLHCYRHIICNIKCFPNRYHGAITKEDMLKCSKCYDINLCPGIYIFVDDSNIWIGAKALQSKLKRFKTVEDHRVRIDVGKLTDVLADKRPVSKGVLYGSEPPPVDTVWKKIKEQGWRVETDRKHKYTGKEKKVDTRLVAEVTGLAIRTPIEERTTIVLVSGDADMIPAIEEVLKESHWQVEVCMWKHVMSRDLHRFERDNHDRVKVNHLDDFLGKVSFTTMKFKISHKILHLVNKGGIVFSIEDRAFDKGGNFCKHIPTQSWLNQLESIAQWPFQYYWFDSQKYGRTHNLVVVFRRDSKVGEFDVEKFIADIKLDEGKKQYCLPNTTKVQTFLDYQTQFYKKPVNPELQVIDDALEQVGIYDGEEALAGSDNETVYEADPSDNWKTCRRQPRSNRRLRQQYSDLCPFKYNCKFGTRCQSQHTDDEKAYFKGRNEGRGNPVRKVHSCRYFDQSPPSCMKMKHECEYAHGEADAWCLNCLLSGHFTDHCPEQA